MHNWSGNSAGQADALNSGPLEHRLCYVLVLSELEGPQTARESLQDLDDLVSTTDYDRDEIQTRLTDIISSMLGDYEQGDWGASSITDDDRSFLTDQLGFSAEMSLAPSEGSNVTQRDALIDKAKASTIFLFLLMGIVLVGGILGLFCFGALALMLALKTFAGANLMRSHFV